MDEIVVNRKNVTATKNEIQEDFVFRISKHNRGFVVKTSANLELSNTLFLDSERDIAQDIIFNEIQGLFLIFCYFFRYYLKIIFTRNV